MRGAGAHVLRASLVERAAPLAAVEAGCPPAPLRAVAAQVEGPTGRTPGRLPSALRGRPRGAPRLRGALVLLAGGLALALGGLLGG